jgi:thioester reductase-like protein
MMLQARESAPEDVGARLTAAVAQFLGVSPAELDRVTPLGRMGLDSLAALELVAAIQDELGRPVPEWLCAGQATLEDLEAALLGAPRSADCRGDAEAELIAGDSRWPDGIRAPLQSPIDPPRAVLLTGATGFLGAFLLRELLDSTSATVYCLVRGDHGDGHARLRNHLEDYRLSGAAVAGRVRLVSGDVSRPSLGLSSDAWSDLSLAVDAIYHAAADVNWVLPYAMLRDANVLGTGELLRLACTATPKAFHFVSSLSVCYATGAAASRVSPCESTDMQPYVASLPLGYARSKCAAESLVRQAAARGLRARIYRPALIGGDSTTGSSNLSDIVAALIKGCIQTGAAPDLDWTFDAPAVDEVAKAIVRLPDPHDQALRTFHLVHRQPRAWRECVLWMNVRGYRCPLMPYDEWRARLDADTHSPAHALRPLRGFFLDGDRTGTTAAELFQDGWHAPVNSRDTQDLSDRRGLSSAGPDVALIHRYFDDYVRRGFLPPASPRRPVRNRVVETPWWERTGSLERLLQRGFDDASLRVVRVTPGARGSAHSIIGELTAWRSAGFVGMRRIRADVERQGRAESLDLVIKSKPEDQDAIEIAETLAGICGAELGAAVAAHRDRLGLSASHLRELAVYEMRDDRLRRHIPSPCATWRDDERGEWGVALECLDTLELLDTADRPSAWAPAHIHAALAGLAEIHAVHIGRTAALEREPWIGHVTTRESVVAMTPLWTALADHASGPFGAWAGPALVARHRRLAESPASWWPALEAVPPTLLHHDFNLRNIAMRRLRDGRLRLCAYDWELATIGAPQRDLAEFLCFALSPDVDGHAVAGLVDGYRQSLETAAGQVLEASVWHAGWRAAMAELLTNRLAFYAMIDRVRPQTFLPRVVRTWARLDRLAGEP